MKRNTAFAFAAVLAVSALPVAAQNLPINFVTCTATDTGPYGTIIARTQYGGVGVEPILATEVVNVEWLPNFGLGAPATGSPLILKYYSFGASELKLGEVLAGWPAADQRYLSLTTARAVSATLPVRFPASSGLPATFAVPVAQAQLFALDLDAGGDLNAQAASSGGQVGAIHAYHLGPAGQRAPAFERLIAAARAAARDYFSKPLTNLDPPRPPPGVGACTGGFVFGQAANAVPMEVLKQVEILPPGGARQPEGGRGTAR